MPTANMHTIQVGSIQVTAICDLQIPWDTGLFIGPPASTAPSTLCIHYFLLETDQYKILIDTGTGHVMGGEGVCSHLATRAIKTSQITHILLTHLHIDHIGGLFDPSRQLSFPGSKIIAHVNERDYWLGAAAPDFATPSQREQYEFAQLLRPFSQQMTWRGQGQILPGIELIQLPGHTPGHSGYRIHSQGQSLFIIGDIVHQPQAQTANPGVGVEFDTDPALAVTTRRSILSALAANHELMAGMHTDFPAFGFIQRAGDAYAFTHQLS